MKSEYAARAVLGLARRFSQGNAVKVEELASDYHIPPNYLVQILIELKSGNLVKSIRGKDGGYLLVRPPTEISFGDVLRAIHGRVFEPAALATGPGEGNGPAELRAAWSKLQAAVDATADAISFQQLVDEAADKDRMYYI